MLAVFSEQNKPKKLLLTLPSGKKENNVWKVGRMVNLTEVLRYTVQAKTFGTLGELTWLPAGHLDHVFAAVVTGTGGQPATQTSSATRCCLVSSSHINVLF